MWAMWEQCQLSAAWFGCTYKQHLPEEDVWNNPHIDVRLLELATPKKLARKVDFRQNYSLGNNEEHRKTWLAKTTLKTRNYL